MNHMDLEIDDQDFDATDFDDDSDFEDLEYLFPDAGRAPVRMRASKARGFRDSDDAPRRNEHRPMRRGQDRQPAHR